MTAIPIDAICPTCGWPASYAIHAEANRDQSFMTAPGYFPTFVKGHAVPALP
ncbi:MAG TPA: hypothetical protein VGG32_05930 [Thermoplasmata archaeon]|jgi:hypothetical protein